MKKAIIFGFFLICFITALAVRNVATYVRAGGETYYSIDTEDWEPTELEVREFFPASYDPKKTYTKREIKVHNTITPRLLLPPIVKKDTIADHIYWNR